MVSREKAAAAIDMQVRQYIITQYAPYITSLRAYRKWSDDSGESKPARPKPPAPLAIQVTTGVGKTELIRRIRTLCTSLGIPTLVLVPNHALADSYAAAGWSHYHGRAAESGDARHDWDCQMHEMVQKITSKHHFPQAIFCVRHCQHGRKWVLDTSNEGSRRQQNAIIWFQKAGINSNNIEPCRWQGHLREMMRKMHLVAVAQALSDSLRVWAQTLMKAGSVDGEDVPRLLIIDESAEVSAEISVSLESLAEWSGQIRGLLDAIKEAAGDGVGEELSQALDVFQKVARWLGENALAEKSGPVPNDLREQIAAVGQSKKIWEGATAAWEIPVFGKRSGPEVPLRAARAIVATLAVGGGRIERGRLHVVGLSQVGEFLSEGTPGIVLDATLPVAVGAAVMIDKRKSHG